MAAVTPQTILYEFERLSPAGSVVEAATSQSRQTLPARRESATVICSLLKGRISALLILKSIYYGY
jgi:hypothetical protein